MTTLAATPREAAPALESADACARALADVQAALDAQGIDRDTRFGEQVFLKLLDRRLGDDRLPSETPATGRSDALSGDFASPDRIIAGLADWFGVTESRIAEIFRVPPLDDGYPELRMPGSDVLAESGNALVEFAMVQAAATQAIGAPPRLDAIRRAAAAHGLATGDLGAALAASPHASLVGDSAADATFVILDDDGLALARAAVQSWTA